MYEDRTGRRNASGMPDPTFMEAARRADRAAVVAGLTRCRMGIIALAKMHGAHIAGGWLRDDATGEELPLSGGV